MVKLQLRGHHISLFAMDCLEDKFYKTKVIEHIHEYNAPILNEYPRGRLSQNKKLIKEDRGWSKIIDSLSNSMDITTSVYGERLMSVLDFFWDLLKTQPDTEVEIVGGLDSICKADCLNLNHSCAQVKEGDEDQTTLEEYGLKVGETYTARELIQRVIDFTTRTGFRSPRDKLFVEWGLT